MSGENPLSQENEIDCELKDAMAAAFGADAMSMLEDDDDISDEMLVTLCEETEPTVTADDDEASPLIRFVKELNSAIYENRGSSTGRDCEEDVRASRYIVFSVGNQQFGLPFSDVREIARCPKITSLPRTAPWLRGVANLRGQILSVTDLRILFHLDGKQPPVGEKIIVVQSKQHAASTAIVADVVHGIRELRDHPMDASDAVHRVAKISSGMASFDQIATVLIDPDKLFGSTELITYA